MTRAFDLVFGLVLAILFTPLMLLLALFVLLVAGRPAFFISERVGRHGERFGLIKIRSMESVAGASVTAADDARLRPWGRGLRRYRLDELPQLWQVVSGRLALVGPRAEAPRLILADDPRELRLQEQRPGLVDPAVLGALEEEGELAGRIDPEAWYRAVLRPRKLDLSLAYLERRGLGSDLALLARAFMTLLRPGKGKR